MHKSQVPHDKILAMAAEATRCMAPGSYEQGRNLFEQDRVKWVKVFGPRIYSLVEEGKTYMVTIHIDTFAQSTCTCAKKHLCEHIAAVFLHYHNSRAMEIESSPGIRETGNKKVTLKSASLPQLNQARSGTPGMEGPVTLWYDYFEQTYRRIREHRRRPYQLYSDYIACELFFTARLYEEFKEAVSIDSPSWPPLNIALYRFHSALFFMDMLENQIKDAKPSYVDNAQLEIIWQVLLGSYSTILHSQQRETYPLFQSMMQKAVEVTRGQLFQNKIILFDWLMLYRLLCVTSFDTGLEKETLYLEKLIQRKPTRQIYYYAVLGLASLRLAANREDDALSVLQQLKEKHADDMFFYLEYFAGAKDWDKLLLWLNWLTPDIQGASPVVFKDICKYCLQAAKNSQFGPKFIRLLRSWLPRSRDYYAEYLLDEDLFGEWVELNMSYRGCTWDSIDKNLLRQLAVKEPAALIPLYHQWAARLIEKKNRKSYREAVKLLKQLRTLYNKNKATKEWHAFISSLAARHSRMRALQEELRKGKLIS